MSVTFRYLNSNKVTTPTPTPSPTPTTTTYNNNNNNNNNNNKNNNKKIITKFLKILEFHTANSITEMMPFSSCTLFSAQTTRRINNVIIHLTCCLIRTILLRG